MGPQITPPLGSITTAKIPEPHYHRERYPLDRKMSKRKIRSTKIYTRLEVGLGFGLDKEEGLGLG